MAEIIDLRVAQEYDIVCQEADDFLFEMDVQNDDETPFSFAGYTAKLQVRKRRVETDPLILEFTTGEGITLSSGNIKIEKDAADMVDISGDYVYDFKLINSGGFVETWLFGKFKIFPTTTI